MLSYLHVYPKDFYLSAHVRWEPVNNKDSGILWNRFFKRNILETVGLMVKNEQYTLKQYI